MLTVGVDAPSSRRALDIAAAFDLTASVGVHPNSALEWEGAAADGLESMVADDRVVAVGETGLDFYRDLCPPDAQRTAFRAHIELAKAHDKALVIHTRAAVSQAIEELTAAGPPDRLVFHCWSGNADELARALRLGSFVSFAGNVTFPGAGELRELARSVPPGRLLIETDSPFLSPVPHRGKPNEPARVVDVGAAMAESLGIPVGDVAEMTTTNARVLLGLGS
jgi:TatD DNase family protein